MTLSTLVLAVPNESWAAEARRILSELLPALDLRTLPLDIGIGTVSYAAQAASRAYGAVEVTGEWCLGMVEGLEIEALDWKPGLATELFSAEEILGYLADLPEEGRAARIRCTLAVARDETGLGPYESGPAIFQFASDGRIASAAAGEDGFPFDSIFFIPDVGRTLAKMSGSERDWVGARGKALRALGEYLERNFSIGGR
jgi:XTP/dITP diphosphohydrolase